MQLRRAHASGNAEPSRPHGLSQKAPKARLATATVATSVVTLQARYYAGCRRCRRCRQINHHSIWGVILGYQRRPVSAQRIGTTLWSLVWLIADADRLPVAAFWMCSLHQAIIGRRRSM